MDETTRQPGTAAGEPAAANQPRPFRQDEKSGPGLADGAPGFDAGLPGPAAKKRSVYLIGGLALLAIVLAAAAYVGGRLLNRGPAGAAGGQAMMARGEGGVTRSFLLLPAKELPQKTPDVRGVLVRRQDKSLFVGTGVLMNLSDEAPTTYDGPVLEVVVTHDTQIFCDDTGRSAPDIQADKIQQVVKPCSLDDLTANVAISVWGEKTGDRTVARILVCQAGDGIPGAGG
ncbi:MAG: hypothetical protein M1140_06060 [Chloroflexi bacterium]|nr:hypothetical protein [Chloroflexota bacterium]